jgi:hypothetical protein
MSITGSEQWMYSSGREFYDFPIEQSLRFNRADSTYLNRTASSPTLGTKATWSFWIKKCDVVSDTSSSYRTVFYCGTPNVDGFRIGFARYSGNNHVLHISQDNGPSAAYIFMRTEAALRDTSAWYNFVIRYDSTDATAADRIKVYINGELASIQSSPRTNPPLNHIPKWQVSGTTLKIGKGRDDSNEHYDMYLADVNFVDGQALDPTSFGQFKSGIWTPVDTSGLTFGTNGFRLQFGDTTEASGFNTLTWTGTGQSQSISGCGFSPDLIWQKSRNASDNHFIVDSVRGVNQGLSSNSTAAEVTSGASNDMVSFDADGFTTGVPQNYSSAGSNGYNIVSWCWDAGSGSPASNTDGSITSTVKANTDYGFSITSYVGTGANATVGHGLTSAPELIFVRNRSGGDFKVYSEDVGNTYQGFLNDTLAFQNSGATIWNNTSPTSSVFSIGTNAGVNQSGANIIAYAFHSVANYSSIGSYTGTGAAGNSITLGFKPAFIMIKRTDAAFGWYIYDTTRQVQNPMGSQTDPLLANSSNAEGGADPSWYIDVTDTGFTINNTSLFDNASGGSYIYMAFADTRNAAFWRDTSGQGNDWQPNNLVFSDVVPDGTNNFATMNPNDFALYLSEGNLKVSNSTGSGSIIARSTMLVPPNSGKWYFEGYSTVTSSNGHFIGVWCPTGLNAAILDTYYDDVNFGVLSGHECVTYLSNGTIRNNSSSSTVTGLDDFDTAGDIVGALLDMDAQTVQFYNNGTAQGSAQSLPNTTDPYGFFVAGHHSKGIIINAGQDDSFAGLKAPNGISDESGTGVFSQSQGANGKAWNSANMPSGAINTLNDETPEDYFNTVLYSATAGVAGSVTGYGFAPDWIWTKARNAAQSHQLFDNVRGDGVRLITNSTGAESALGASYLSLEDDGFDYGSSTFTSNNFVGWGWKANGSGVSNTDGSITSTVSVGATSQQNWFSIVSYVGDGTVASGSNVGHGLGRKPDAIIVKDRSSAYNWNAWFNSFTGSQVIYPNLTNARNSDANVWSATEPTSNVFYVGNGEVNASSNNYIAYCFANAENLCRVGSYVGNGSPTDGTFVYTGFRPAWVMIKRTNTTGSWVIQDSTRNPYNDLDLYLLAESSNAEATLANVADYCSNGFKLRLNASSTNASGSSYIYLALAEQPFAFANAR